MSRWYKKEYFEKSYEWCLELVNGPKFWHRIGIGAIEPPQIKKMPNKLKKIRIREH